MNELFVNEFFVVNNHFLQVEDHIRLLDYFFIEHVYSINSGFQKTLGVGDVLLDILDLLFNGVAQLIISLLQNGDSLVEHVCVAR